MNKKSQKIKERITANEEKISELKKAVEIALKMLSKGEDIEYIAEITGLSIEQINNLKN